MKYFVISDIHSHFTLMLEALEKKGFKKNHTDHMLIINGDIFDRGKESQEIRYFLDDINNKILIFGNHELLLLEAIQRGFFLKHDLQNGTVDAAIQLAGGYEKFPRTIDGIQYVKKKAKELFKVVNYRELSRIDDQKKIIRALIKTNIVEWIVDNFYLQGSVVKWDVGKTKFKITGMPRYYIQIEDRLIMHGFFPSPDFVKSYNGSSTTRYAILPDDYDLLEESTQRMWEEQGVGIWAITPYWLEKFYQCKLTKLYDYLIRRNVKHIYLGHWTKKEISNMVMTISMTPDYIKYNDKLPKFYFTDGTVVLSKEVLVETFDIISDNK